MEQAGIMLNLPKPYKNYILIILTYVLGISFMLIPQFPFRGLLYEYGLIYPVIYGAMFSIHASIAFYRNTFIHVLEDFTLLVPLMFHCLTVAIDILIIRHDLSNLPIAVIYLTLVYYVAYQTNREIANG